MTTFNDAVMASSPFIYFNCNAPSGSTLPDVSGNGHNGTLNSPFTTGRPPMNSGTGYGIGFANGYVYVPYFSGVRPTSDYTIEAIVRWSSAGYGMLFGLFDTVSPFKGPTVLINYDRYVNSQDPTKITFGDAGATGVSGNDNIYSSPIALNDNVYRHFAFVRRGVHLEMWINGVLVKDFVMSGVINGTQNNGIYIMGRPSAVQPVIGDLDELVFYQAALSSDQIKLHARLAQALLKIAGTAKLDSGSAASAVAVRNWSTGAGVDRVIPASDGSFESFVADGQYDVTVYGPDGYQPITHGPITPVAW